MPFVDDWTTAKSTFETTVNGKKPTKTFWGVFRKGTGIEKALGSLDKAKTKKDAIKAVSEFDKSVKEYCNLLDKEISNPKSVEPIDKEAYVKALGKLKKALEKVKTKADNVAKNLSDSPSGDKDKIDPKLLQQVEDHLGKQRDAVAKLTKLQNEMAGFLNEAKVLYKTGVNAVQNYKKPSLQDMASVNSNIAQEAADKLETLRKDTARKRKDDIYKKVTGAEKTIVETDLKSRVGEIAATQLKLSKSQSESVKKLTTDIDKDYDEVVKLTEDMAELKKEAAPVDRESLLEVQEHIEFRRKMAKEVASWETESKKVATTVAKAAKSATLGLERARSAAQKGNRSEIDQVAELAGKLLSQIKPMVEKVMKEVTDRTKNGSDLMLARSDKVTSNINKLPPSMGKPLRTDLNKAFGVMDTVQRKWQSANDEIQTSFSELEDAVDQIESLAGRVKPASFYLAWLNPAVKEMEDESFLASDRLEKATGLKERILPQYKDKEKTPPIVKAIGQHHGVWNSNKEKVEAARKRRNLLVKRMDNIPSQEKDVKDAIGKIQTSIKAMDGYYDQLDKLVAPVDKLFQELMG